MEHVFKDGLVEYEAHPSDRRTKLLELTPRGLEVLAAIYRRQLAWSEQVVAELRPEKLVHITDALDQIGTVLENTMNPRGTPADKSEGRQHNKGRRNRCPDSSFCIAHH